jgi:hypothetical protein
LATKVVQDLWILEDSGIVVFSRVFNPKVNEQLFGALMTALNTFASELASGGLTSFELSEMRFTLLKTNYNSQRYLFVCNSSKKVNTKKVMDEILLIKDKFFEIYGKKLEKWDGDVNLFSDFETQIEDSLEETIKKFQKAFW